MKVVDQKYGLQKERSARQVWPGSKSISGLAWKQVSFVILALKWALKTAEPQATEKSICQKIAFRAGRAGHFRYFLIFSIIKNDFFALFIKLITYFCISPI